MASCIEQGILVEHLLSSVVPTDAGGSVEQLLPSPEIGQFLSSAVPAEAGASVEQLLPSPEIGQFLSSAVPAEAGACVVQLLSSGVPVEAGASEAVASALASMEHDNLRRAMLARADKINERGIFAEFGDVLVYGYAAGVNVHVIFNNENLTMQTSQEFILGMAPELEVPDWVSATAAWVLVLTTATYKMAKLTKHMNHWLPAIPNTSLSNPDSTLKMQQDLAIERRNRKVELLDERCSAAVADDDEERAAVVQVEIAEANLDCENFIALSQRIFDKLHHAVIEVLGYMSRYFSIFQYIFSKQINTYHM